MKERWRKYRLGKTGFYDLFKGILRFYKEPEYSKTIGYERGYIYFQDFIPDNKFDLRVIVIGKRAFALKRLVRKGDFRASGSGNLLFDKKEFDERCIKIAFDTNKKLNAQCLAYDFVFDESGCPLIVEISYGFAVEAYDSCPGYWDDELNWFEGKFNPQELDDQRINRKLFNEVSYKIIYIAGDGHSGSTLLDIILGSSEKIFSAGELNFITRDTIFDEYCSCGRKIKDCEFWQGVINTWLAGSQISYEAYCELRLRYERNKTSLRTLWNKIYPSRHFVDYVNSTQSLFDAIHLHSGANIIIDSSKAPTRIAVLQKNNDLQVIHLIREFKGVLNSAKKSSKKNIRLGIEKDSPPRRTLKTVFDWIFSNLLTEIFCIGVKSSKLTYKNYIHNLKSIEQISLLSEGINLSHPFSADHMLAGNIIRLKKDLKIDKNVGFRYSRLSKNQLQFAKYVDKIFWFWSKSA